MKHNAAPALAVTEYVLPTPSVTYATAGPLTEFVANAPGVNCATPAAVTVGAAEAPDVTYTAPAPMTAYDTAPAPMTTDGAPALAVTCKETAPVIEHVLLARTNT